MQLSSRAYDILKYLCTIVFPAIGSLYFGLSKIWGFPYAEEVVGTISVLCTFIGTCLKISSDNYYKEEQEVFFSEDNSGLEVGEEIVPEEADEEVLEEVPDVEEYVPEDEELSEELSEEEENQE